MLIIIKSSSDTPECKRGIKLAADMAANVLLIQNAVYFAQGDRQNFSNGIIYALEDDIRLRGLRDEELRKDLKKLNYETLVELMIEEDKVIGIF